ncbi:MAG TPA: protein translocase subunit SecD [Patescibacteria group bacterium]|nr:protein translocase subunit SecD [Patescibacteria group bacterium]
MKSSRSFLAVLIACAILLLFIDLPTPLKLGTHTIPVINKKINLNFDSSNLNLAAGPIRIAKNMSYRLGLDLQGGTRFVYQVDMKNVPASQRDSAFEGARSVIDRRVNFFGVSEPSIQSLKLPNDYRIIIELPGATNVDQALDLIGRTAEMSFWEDGKTPMATADAYLLPLGMTNIYKNKPIQTPLTGKDLKSAQVVYGSGNGTPQVQLKFTANGTKLFADITKRNVGKPVAIALDNVVISAPTVNQIIPNGDAVIQGQFTQDQAKNLAIQLNAGALPAPLKLIGQTVVGPSLGIESLQKSLLGGLIGLLTLIIFMTFLYKKEGILASIALMIYTIIVMFIFKFIPITLTLAGIAGFILSIGMAVDANILIFERMKEELRLGKPRIVAMRLGFSRAWPSIRDSNTSSLITTFILFYFGTGVIRGFAVALFIGIVVSMFSAIFITKNLLKFFEGENI